MEEISLDKKRTVDKLTLGEFKALFEKGECPICQMCAATLERFFYWNEMPSIFRNMKSGV